MSRNGGQQNNGHPTRYQQKRQKPYITKKTQEKSQKEQYKVKPELSAEAFATQLKKNDDLRIKVNAVKKHLTDACAELQQYLDNLLSIEEYTPQLYEDMQLKIYVIRKKIDVSEKILITLGDSTAHKQITVANHLIKKINQHLKELVLQTFLNDLETHFSDLEEQLRDAQERSNIGYFFTGNAACSDFLAFRTLIGELTECKKHCEKQLRGKNTHFEVAVQKLKEHATTILAKPENQELMRKHRGNVVWRNLVGLLEKLEIWLRTCTLPWNSDRSLSIGSHSRYFSTKTAKTAEKFVENINKLTPPNIKKL